MEQFLVEVLTVSHGECETCEQFNHLEVIVGDLPESQLKLLLILIHFIKLNI
jgi:hypothetical protein